MDANVIRKELSVQASSVSIFQHRRCVSAQRRSIVCALARTVLIGYKHQCIAAAETETHVIPTTSTTMTDECSFLALQPEA